MPAQLLEPAGHLSADLGLRSYHHQSLVRPKSRLTHLPGSQQMPDELLEPAGHPSADLGLQSCPPPFSGSPQVTTDPSARIAANASLVA